MIKPSGYLIFSLSLLAAALLWLGFPGGGGFWPVLFLAFIPLLYLVYGQNSRWSFIAGIVTGFLHFIFTLYWIVIVLGRYGGLPWFFSIPAVILLSLYMSLFVACFGMLSSLTLKRWSCVVALWVIPAIWVGLDWLRSFLFSGFPWMDPGYAFYKVPFLIQSADLFGHHFITYLLLLLNCLLFLLWKGCTNIREKTQMIIPVAVLFFMVALYGHYRWQQLENTMSAGESVVVGIVQGNIDQSRKWIPSEQESTIETYISQTSSFFEGTAPDLVVWPETALPFFPQTNALIEKVQLLAMKKKVTLLTGSPWFEVVDRQTREMNFYNSSFLLLPTGEVGDIYFKSHLVPFGEYVPIKKYLPFLAPLVEAVGDFTPGKIEKPMVSGPIKGGVLICFESIFPDIARRWVKVGANLLVNLTNDAWYGKSSAPSQSMSMSVFRAVETRRSLVRAANTGISGFVDPLGRVKVSSEIFTIWSKSMKVDLMDEITIHSRIGYLFGPFCLLLSFLFLISAKLWDKKHRHLF